MDKNLNVLATQKGNVMKPESVADGNTFVGGTLTTEVHRLLSFSFSPFLSLFHFSLRFYENNICKRTNEPINGTFRSSNTMGELSDYFKGYSLTPWLLLLL